jgi:hypothetical protein
MIRELDFAIIAFFATFALCSYNIIGLSDRDAIDCGRLWPADR